MKEIYLIRLKSFERSLGVLKLPANKLIWENKTPEIFTQKVDEAGAMTATLRAEQSKQETQTSGITSEKDREETELENAAYTLAQALVLFFTDKNQESEAGEIDLTASDWEKLADSQLLNKSQRVIELATPLFSSTATAKAAQYGITEAAIQSLTKERADYDKIVNEPSIAASLRAALTKGFGEAFRLVESKFKELDKLIIQFGTTAEGRTMIAAWKDARVKKGANADSNEEKPAPTPAPPAQ